MHAVKERRSGDLTVEQMMKVIDVYGRLAFGGQCVAAMGMLAGPALLITASIVPFFVWGDNRGEAIGIALGGWALGIAVAVASIGFALFCWRWSGDWITEWPGYATGFGIAGIACAALAYLMTSTPVPIWDWAACRARTGSFWSPTKVYTNSACGLNSRTACRTALTEATKSGSRTPAM